MKDKTQDIEEPKSTPENEELIPEKEETKDILDQVEKGEVDSSKIPENTNTDRNNEESRWVSRQPKTVFILSSLD